MTRRTPAAWARVAFVMLLVGGALVLTLFQRVASTPRSAEAELETQPAMESVAASA